MTIYVIRAADGSLRQRRHRGQPGGPVTAFRFLHTAKRECKRAGDSVVAVDIPDDREPVFIRGARP